jgi:hypothetical protein
MNLCNQMIERRNPIAFGGLSYDVCEKPVKYKIKYINPVNGKIKEQELCGRHFMAAQKNAIRLKEKRGFDTHFEYEEL